ncbi:acetylglutamate kinase [Permianibacter aggregans]|uniref:Acetylglutamate kinase n=1 Tax=Permianibacter aggregans TaxID=1510150 RepID=A0A4R6UFM1_9GAMM|nr:acetylglutamate kinase [Permianibacter aggregans]QGX38493.1 acetylglutamate kinase [Permianibacter aggregans]TDQ45052.1 N-acetylglutamate kinase [Permianibacter aggregans]
MNPVVVKLSGGAIEDPIVIANLMPALQELAAKQPLILVHGGGKQVDAHFAHWQYPVEKKNGLRVSPAEHMPLITAVLAGQVNKQLLSAAKVVGMNAVGVSLADGDSAVCSPHPDASLGAVGIVDPGKGKMMQALLGAGFVPIVASIALDQQSQLRNVNADDAAVCLAALTKAQDLLLLSDVSGVRDAEGKTHASMTKAQIQQEIANGVIQGGMIAKVMAAMQAAAQLGKHVTIASYLQPDAIRRYAHGQDIGTHILAV